MIRRTEEAWEHAGPAAGPFLFICEHASGRVPAPLVTSTTDDHWLASHWGVDVGAGSLCLALSQRLSSPSVLARFSRLLCDANRHRDHPDLIRPAISGTPLSFNSGLDEAEVVRRIELYHEPYHQAVDAALQDSGPAVVLVSVHSFTPVWDEQVRTMDVGVLFDEARSGPDARQLQTALEAEGFFTALNEPYSGANGLMYAADRHGQDRGVRHLELELNQATICTPRRIERVADRLAVALRMLLG
jgi:predicted N-formylglutamate amidohydrolase